MKGAVAKAEEIASKRKDAYILQQVCTAFRLKSFASDAPLPSVVSV